MKIYSDRRFIPPGATHTAILAPFWGPMEEAPEWEAGLRFERYSAAGEQYHQVTDTPEEADLVVLPTVWNHYQRWKREDLALQFAAEMAPYGKRLVVFADCDRYEELPFPGATVFRTSLYRSTRKPDEYAQPAWSADLIRCLRNGALEPREKSGKPVVGFCGIAAPAVRSDAMRVLHASGRVTTDFILRKWFFGGSIWWESPGGIITPHWDHALGAQVRQEFLENTLRSDYVLCARGGGNFSHRFYETLICGRIPIFIDTDCVLPYHDSIDWKRFTVWCDESELESLPDRVADFHERLSPEEFLELQKACRRLWEERLSAHGFFEHFDEHFGSRGAATST
jgi:Exostosin family